MDLSSFSLIVHAAAPCPVVGQVEDDGRVPPDAEIHELYGASEGGATKISPDEWRDHPGSVGRPWPGVEIRILDEERQPVATGESGAGLHPPARRPPLQLPQRRGATCQAWQDDAFTVGDIGHLDADGYLTITDRVSDMVLWGGVNIAPREIEEVLFQHPAVVDCAVFGIPHPRDGERLKAMVQLRGGEISDLAEFVGVPAGPLQGPPRLGDRRTSCPVTRTARSGSACSVRTTRPERKGTMMRIEIDRDKCVGSGNCVFWAPATFDLDDDGQSVVVDPSGDTEDRIQMAVEGCPAKAIAIGTRTLPLSRWDG